MRYILHQQSRKTCQVSFCEGVMQAIYISLKIIKIQVFAEIRQSGVLDVPIEVFS